MTEQSPPAAFGDPLGADETAPPDTPELTQLDELSEELRQEGHPMGPILAGHRVATAMRMAACILRDMYGLEANEFPLPEKFMQHCIKLSREILEDEVRIEMLYGDVDDEAPDHDEICDDCIAEGLKDEDPS